MIRYAPISRCIVYFSFCYDKKHFRRGVLQNLFNYYEPIFDFEQPRKTDEDDDNYDEDEYVDFEAPLPSDGYEEDYEQN